MQMELNGREKICAAVELSKKLRGEIKKIHGLKTFDAVKNFALDATKVTVNVQNLGLTGQEAEKILRRDLKVQCELSDAANLLFLITYADDAEIISKLIEALKLLPRGSREKFSSSSLSAEISLAELSPRETFYSPVEVVPLKKSVGRICAEEITFYPPGIPLLMPGEKIAAQVVELIEREKFLRVIGAADKTLSTIKVVNRCG